MSSRKYIDLCNLNLVYICGSVIIGLLAGEKPAFMVGEKYKM